MGQVEGSQNKMSDITELTVQQRPTVEQQSRHVVLGVWSRQASGGEGSRSLEVRRHFQRETYLSCSLKA
jgi:hypothetical protein